jgi:hypothetical protein
MITEKEYLDAVRIVNDYTEQIRKKSEKILKNAGINKTPMELKYDWQVYFPLMNVRIYHILIRGFAHTKLCNITKKDFLSVQTAGLKSWLQLCEMTGISDK